MELSISYTYRQLYVDTYIQISQAKSSHSLESDPLFFSIQM